MNKRIVDLNFNDVDFSSYEKEIGEINEIFNSLKSNRKFMKKFTKFMKSEMKENYNIVYNRLPISSKGFRKKSNMTSSINVQSYNNNYCEIRDKLSLYS